MGFQPPCFINQSTVSGAAGKSAFLEHIFYSNNIQYRLTFMASVQSYFSGAYLLMVGKTMLDFAMTELVKGEKTLLTSLIQNVCVLLHL